MEQPNSPTSPANHRQPWWHNEDWLAVLGASLLLLAVQGGLWNPVMASLKWKSLSDLGSLMSSAQIGSALGLILPFIALSTLLLASSLGRSALGFLPGAAVVFGLAWLAQILAANETLKGYGLEYVIFALGLGLAVSHLLPIGPWLQSAIRTEFFIKTGIVILGAGMLFGDLLKAGLPGLIQAALVIPVIWTITFRLSRRLRVDDEFGVMLSTAVSICGVSAAIAACGAIDGDKKKLSYVSSVVLLCAVPMLILMPIVAQNLHLPSAVTGAWLGGTLDTSGSVLAATEMADRMNPDSANAVAAKVGTVVKLSQNVLIGVAAFVISLWWTLRGPNAGPNSKDNPGSPALRSRASVIWERFPKFVLGFLVASLLFSFALAPEAVKASEKTLKSMREWWFAAAFVCIGLETRLGDIARMQGGRPALAFIGGQLINILWTLLLAWLLFRNWK